MNNIIYISSAWDKVYFFRLQWTLLNVRDTRFGLPETFYTVQSAHYNKRTQYLDYLDLSNRQLLRHTRYDKTVHTEIHADYRIEIASATDELCKSK